MITKLHIENFKCLRDVTVKLSPLTGLIGKNDTGKTSFLEALGMLGGLVSRDGAIVWPDPSIDNVDLAWRGGAEDPVASFALDAISSHLYLPPRCASASSPSPSSPPFSLPVPIASRPPDPARRPRARPPPRTRATPT